MRETIQRQALWTPDDIVAGHWHGASPAAQEALTKAWSWVQGFIMKPHPELGRSGAVCPFVKPAMENQAFYFAVSNQHRSIRALHKEVQELADQFDQLAVPSSFLKCITIVYPNTPGRVIEALMTPDNRPPMKTELLRRNIMTGQFYPTCPVRASLNPRFFPLRAPVTMLVLRNFIESDWRFLKDNLEWRMIYQQRFGKIPADASPLAPSRFQRWVSWLLRE
jgi:hypothetical protein